MLDVKLDCELYCKYTQRVIMQFNWLRILRDAHGIFLAGESVGVNIPKTQHAELLYEGTMQREGK